MPRYSLMAAFRLLLILWPLVLSRNVLNEKQRIQLSNEETKPSDNAETSPLLRTFSIPTLALQNVGGRDTVQYDMTTTIEIVSSAVILYTLPEGSAYRHSPCIAPIKSNC
jgi:hypothetical protein